MVTATRTGARRLVTGGDPDARFVVPVEGDFTDLVDETVAHDYIPAPEVREVGEALIDACPEFAHLRGVEIAYLWRREGGKTKGRLTLGKCTKPSGLLAHFSGATWVVWLAADHIGVRSFTAWQVEALVYHELCHTSVAGEDDTPTLVGHDVEAFRAELARYGLWKPDLEGLKGPVQLALRMDAYGDEVR